MLTVQALTEWVKSLHQTVWGVFSSPIQYNPPKPVKPQASPSFPHFHQFLRRVLVSVLVLMVIEPKFRRRNQAD